MEIIIVLILISLIAFSYMRFEAGFLKVKRINAKVNPDGLKIVFLTDLHIERLFIPVRRILKIIKKEEPDFIILGGDYLDYWQSAPRVLQLFKELSRLAPSISVLGNHDYKSFRSKPEKRDSFFRDIKSTGVRLLVNESIYTIHNRLKYKITGIDDLNSGRPDLSIVESNDAFDIHILISHSPDIIYKLKNNAVDYLLSGHIHGGQIRTPFKIEFTLLRDDKIYEEGIISGLHKMKGINLYISNGIGNTFLPLRLFSRPDITIINI